MTDRKIEIEKPEIGLDIELKTALWIMAVKPGLNIPYITDSEENGKFQIEPSMYLTKSLLVIL